MRPSHPINVLNLNVRMWNGLVRDERGYRFDGNECRDYLKDFRAGSQITPDELTRVPDAYLLKLQNIGKGSVAHLRAALAAWQARVAPDCEDAFRLASFGEGA